MKWRLSASPLLGPFNMQDPRDVMKRGLLLPPVTALSAQQRACTPLAIIHGTGDEVVSPKCAEQLQDQALASLSRARIQVERSEASGATAAVTVSDFRDGGALRLRRIDIAGLGHEWTGGPGGHPYCEQGGAPLVTLCEEFLRQTGVLRLPGA